MYNSCSKIVKSFLLYQNPLYSFSFPISLIIAIIVYGICVSMKCTSNSYILQIFIPIFTIILVNLLIEVVSNLMIDQNEVKQLTSNCLSVFSKREHFQGSGLNEEISQEKIIQSKSDSNSGSESLRSPLNIIDNLYNDTFQIINNDPTQYTLPYNGLNTESLCKIA